MRRLDLEKAAEGDRAAFLRARAGGVLNLRANEAITRPFRRLPADEAALAQLVEHVIRNDGVRCSSHLSGTIVAPFHFSVGATLDEC